MGVVVGKWKAVMRGVGNERRMHGILPYKVTQGDAGWCRVMQGGAG